MQTNTKTIGQPRAARAAKQKAGSGPKIDIELRAEDGQLVQVQVPSKTLVKALGWGAAVLVGIEVVKAGAERFSRARAKSAPRRAAARR